MSTETQARPTRPHGQRTRRQILEAAVDCLVELGYAGTTTVEVQARAGVSRGSLLHHFPSRDELLVAAVAHLGETRVAALFEQLMSTADRRNPIDAAVDAMWGSFQGSLFVAATELWVAARTNPSLQAALKPVERELGQRIQAGYREFLGPVAQHPRFPEVLELLINNMRGFALTHNFHQDRRRDAAHLAAWKHMAHELLATSVPRTGIRRPIGG